MENTPVYDLKIRSVLVLVGLGLLAFISYLLIETIIENQKMGATEINVAGRQRMLSQRITLLGNQLNAIKDERLRSQAINRLKENIELMRQSHFALTHGDAKQGLSAPYSKAIQSLYFGSTVSVDTKVQAFLDEAGKNLSKAVASNELWQPSISVNLTELLRSLDAVVAQYQAESEAGDARLLSYQALILGLTITLLAGGWLLVLRPIMGRVYRYTSDLTETEEHFRSLSKSSTAAILISADHTGAIVSWNPAAERAFGYAEVEVLGRPLMDIVPERYREAHHQGFQRAVHSDEQRIIGKSVEVYGLKKSGEEFPIQMSLGTWKQAGKKYFNAIILDISERKQAEEKLQTLSRAVEASSSAVIIAGIDGNIEYVNSKFSEITGYSKEEAVGQNPHFLSSGETPGEVYTGLWETIILGGEWKGELRNQRKDGRCYWARASISAVRDTQGKVAHYIAIQDDMTQEYELTEQLSYQASHDPLTGLINRREFERRAERLFQTLRQVKGEHALCYLDLDQFKIVNDSCGHVAGDELLRQISMVLQGTVRQNDTLARLGGDEFGVLMEHCSLGNAHRAASTLLKAIQDFQFSWKGQYFRVGVSIGLVGLNEATPNLSELLKEADAACYMAKDAGRNRIHTHHPGDRELALRHGEMQWVGRIHQALDEQRFCLYAQPIVPLDGCADQHYELLIRMKGEGGKIIAPGEFLPAAERYDLIEHIDRWVVDSALRLLSDHPAFVEQTHFVSINLSGPSLNNEEFLDSIISQLKASGIDGNKICFEITETAAIANLNTAMKFISTLKELGCRFALDDFGSGLSSFAYLKNLPVDFLKIDGMFVKGIVDDPIDRAMVKSINDIGQVMGMETIAEFVENNEIESMLKAMGVNYAQGYGIGKPQPLLALLEQTQDLPGRDVALS